MMTRRFQILAAVVAVLWCGGVMARGPAALDIPHLNPEVASGFEQRSLATAQHYMISAANPIAAQAGADILAAGGSAADAVIATQLVLNVVEPQSSGIGGGGFLISYEASSGTVRAYDGRETAPAVVRPEGFASVDSADSFWGIVNSGRSVGTPGLVRMLADLHERQGRLPWGQLFEPAIGVADNGFKVSPRLHKLLSENDALREQAAAEAYFFDESGQPWHVGHVLKNPALAQVYRTLAFEGPDAFYTGWIAERMVDAVQSHAVPGTLSLDDLRDYQALQRDPLCMPYKLYTLCGMPPPSAGPLAVMQIMGILAHTPVAEYAPDSAMAVHYFSEAGRLAFADRDAYVADPDFADVPTQALLDPDYLQRRAALIRSDRSMGVASPGKLPGMVVPQESGALELPSTTHLVAADPWGNVVSMTTSIESAFGSKIFVEGFLLNNQLTDFTLGAGSVDDGPSVNRVEPLKRPRSSMAPMLVLHDGQPFMAIGSPGGSAIINYVAKAIFGVLDWNLDIQQAIDLPNYGSRNQDTELEAGSSVAGLADALRELGHTVRLADFPSGLHGLVITVEGIEGGADPRREGRALGQ